MAKEIEGEAMLIVGEKKVVIDNPLIMVIDSKTKEVKEIIECRKEDSK